MRTRKNHAKNKGTATIELLLIAPFLAGLVILIFFMGWGSVNILNLQESNRYVAWRSTYGYDSHPQTVPDRLNSYFMGNSAVNVTIDAHAGPTGTIDSYKSQARTDSADAGDLADLLTSYTPNGATHTVTADFPASVPLWRMFTGNVNRTSGRERQEWLHRSGATQRRAVIQLYMTETESLFAGVGGKGAPMAAHVRSWYSNGW